jgi:hypothetical protein
MSSVSSTHTISRPYVLPAHLVSAMRFRPRGEAEPDVRHPGANLNGADIRLLMVLWAYLGSLELGDYKLAIPNAVLVKLYGSASQERIERALARLEATEMWTGKEWLPALLSHKTMPGTAPSAKEVVGPVRTFVLPGPVTTAIKYQSQRRAGVTSLRVSFDDLLQLESRYSICIYLKYRAWMTGQCVPVWQHGISPKADGISMDVPPEDVPAAFGYGGHLAPSVVNRLFVTSGGVRTAVARELQRVRVDIEVSPLTSQLKGKDAFVYEINMADFKKPYVAPRLSDLNDSPRKTAKRIVHRKKKKVVKLAMNFST